MRFSLDRLTRKQQAIVDLLADSQIAKDLVAKADDANVARRRKLVAELSTPAADMEKKATAAYLAAVRAEAEVRKAEQALQQAREAHQAALVTQLALSLPLEVRRAQIERELEEGADPRIEHFLQECDARFQKSRNAAPKQVFFDEKMKKARLDFSAATTTTTALRDAMARARELRLQALSAAEVRAALQRLCDELAPALKTLEQLPITLDADE